MGAGSDDSDGTRGDNGGRAERPREDDELIITGDVTCEGEPTNCDTGTGTSGYADELDAFDRSTTAISAESKPPRLSLVFVTNCPYRVFPEVSPTDIDIPTREGGGGVSKSWSCHELFLPSDPGDVDRKYVARAVQLFALLWIPGDP